MASPRDEERPERGSERQTEYLINEFAIAQALVGKFVSGVGFLALTWSTVVLLGGFVGELQMKEFWFLTTVSLVLASTILDIYDYNPDIGIAVLRCFVRLLGQNSVDAGFMKFCSQLCLSIPFAVVQYVFQAVVFINMYGPVATMVISLMRLIQHDYDGSDAASKGKLRAALFVFYCLALVHGVCFFCWFQLRSFLIELLDIASKQCEFDGKWGQKVLRGYCEETKLKYAKGPRLPTGWNLVAYAVGLLDSESLDDNLSGVRMLDKFVDKRTRSIRVELLSSRRAMQNLITMLGWTTLDVQEMRECAARIMADISSDLRIARFPGALQCVSSLLEASPQKRHQEVLGLSVLQDPGQSSANSGAGTMQANSTEDSRQTRFPRLRRIWSRTANIVSAHRKKTTKELKSIHELLYSHKRRDEEETAFETKGTKELVRQGLLILKRLAYDEHNFREIANTQVLLSKITPSIISQAFPDGGYDDTWVKTLKTKNRAIIVH